MAKYKKKVDGRSYQAYDSKILEKAVQEYRVSRGTSLRYVEQKFEILLYDYVKNQYQPIKKTRWSNSSVRN